MLPNVYTTMNSTIYSNYLNKDVGFFKFGYEPDDRVSRLRFSAGAGNFSLHHCVQNCSGAHPASYQMGTTGSFSGGKAAGA
jgi:hypothetical protein